MPEQRPRIVLVEDNPGDVRLLRLALGQAGLDCDLQVLHDGGEGLALARDAGLPRPDLIVLDLNIPKNDGLEVLAALRAAPALSEVPVVVFSSSSSPAERARVQELGAAMFLAKPPDLDRFLAIGCVLKSVLATRLSRR